MMPAMCPARSVRRCRSSSMAGLLPLASQRFARHSITGAPGQRSPSMDATPGPVLRSLHGRGVAQSGSAPAWGAGGRWFKSNHPDHLQPIYPEQHMSTSGSGKPPWVLEHLERYLATDGEDGHMWRGTPTLLLTTTGRKSGKAITTPLIYGEHGGNCIVVASRGGAPDHPQWYYNLTANPTVRVQVAADRFTPAPAPRVPMRSPRCGSSWPASTRRTTSTRRRPSGRSPSSYWNAPGSQPNDNRLYEERPACDVPASLLRCCPGWY